MAGVGGFGPDQVGQQSPDFGDGERDEVTAARFRVPFFDRVTVRKAWASMDRVMCRYQPVYWRTWEWSRPVSPFAVWKVSSMAQRVPATRTRSARPVRAGAWQR